MKIKNKTQLMTALSVFQLVASTASADLKTVFVAENLNEAVICDVAQLDRNETINGWPGNSMDQRLRGSNTNILKTIDKTFAGGEYFDEYPHKLPRLFQTGACFTVKK